MTPLGTNSLRIVVTGLAATYPLGGVFWDYIQYVLGLLRLGHDVLYLEDTGRWCYDPGQQTFVESGKKNARLLHQRLMRLEPRLGDCWSYRDATGEWFGRPQSELLRFCREADLFLHISASCQMSDDYFAAGTVAFIDSDPMYTQASVPAYASGEAEPMEADRIEMLLRHDVFFTFAENLDGPDCRIPRELFRWIPTRQPIVIDCFRDHRIPLTQRRKVLTTIASWEPTEKGPVVAGTSYSGKSTEFLRFLSLPELCSLPFELALSGKFPRDQLVEHGWDIIDAFQVSHNPWVYRDYLARSCGEWSVAKNAYVASRSGWFSCRSACYLASGVPVIVQNTGFDNVLPTDRGILPFETLEQAQAAVDEVRRNPERHAQAAEEIAHQYFASDRVLTQLLESIFSRDTAPS